MTAGVPALESTGFGSGRIVVKYNPEYPEKKVYDRQYFITDHLGSVRVVFDQSGEVLARNDYYPFGKQHDNPALVVPTAPEDNRFLFNGKEKQLTGGLNLIDYGWRMYDPELGIWHGIDLLAEDTKDVSPLVYALNNPLRYIDPTGMAAVDLETKYFNKHGDLLHETNDGLNDIIIVKDANIPELKNELQTANNEGTIDDPETNQQKMHTLGQTPEQYTEDAFKGSGSYEWKMGYKSAYKKSFAGESTFGVMAASSIAVIGSDGQGDSGPQHLQGGVIAGKYDGKQDRKAGNINRLNPYSSLKNNPPLIKLMNSNMDQITFPYPGKGLAPR